MKPVFATLRDMVADHGRAVMVTVVTARGSTPREVGARILVRPDGGFSGTIGGGTLEWQALARAQAMLRAADLPEYEVRAWSLGPDLGQCCGGRVDLGFELFVRADLAELDRLAVVEARGDWRCRGRIGADGRLRREVLREDEASPLDAMPGVGLYLARDRVVDERFADRRRTVLLYGAGHVGRALVLAFAPLPFRLLWIDPRPDAFPGMTPANAQARISACPAEDLANAPDGAFVLIMTHSHALDLDIAHAALTAGRFPFVGVIGSDSKRARFVKRLREMGHSLDAAQRLVCPIGIAGLSSKLPAVIAASVVADCLGRDQVLRAAADTGTIRAMAERG